MHTCATKRGKLPLLRYTRRCAGRVVGPTSLSRQGDEISIGFDLPGHVIFADVTRRDRRRGGAPAHRVRLARTPRPSYPRSIAFVPTRFSMLDDAAAPAESRTGERMAVHSSTRIHIMWRFSDVCESLMKLPMDEISESGV